jgi:hypothetical protein
MSATEFDDRIRQMLPPCPEIAKRLWNERAVGTSFGTQKSLATTLNDVISGKRRCPVALQEGLADEIFRAISLDRSLEPRAAEQLLLESISRLRWRDTNLGWSEGANELFSISCNPKSRKALLYVVTAAKEIIVTMPPVVVEDILGRSLMRIVLQRLWKGYQVDGSCVKLTFWCRSALEATQWWERISAIATDEFPAVENAVLHDFSHGIQVSIAPWFVTNQSVIIADPTSELVRTVLYFHRNEDRGFPQIVEAPRSEFDRTVQGIFEHAVRHKSEFHVIEPPPK